MTSPLNRLIPILQDADAQMTVLLRETAEEAAARVRALAGKEGIGAKIRTAQYRQVRSELMKSAASLYQEVPASLVYGMDRAGQAASKAGEEIDEMIFRQFGGMPEGLAEAQRASARGTVRSYIARTANDIPLSEQVWRTERLSSGLLAKQINMALLLGESWKELADRVRESIVPGVRGGVAYAAKRLGRTEINNAFHTASIANNREKPWVDSFRWNLSGSHPKADVCDEYATEQHYRGGEPGHYHKSEVPAKPHPQCLCYVTAETVGEDEFVASFLGGKYDRYLDEKIGSSAADVTSPTRARPPAANPAKASQAKLRRALNGRLHVKQSISSEKHIHELANEMPRTFQRALAHHEVDVWIGPGSVPDQDHLGSLKGVRPRGWAEGQTWDIVPGAYNPSSRVVALGDESAFGHGSTSLALHEGGHGVDDAVGSLLREGGHDIPASRQDSFSSLWEDIKEDEFYFVINPYFRQGPPAGMSEMWAEGFAAWSKFRSTPNAASKIGQVLTKGFRPLGQEQSVGKAALEKRAGKALIQYFEAVERQVAAALPRV